LKRLFIIGQLQRPDSRPGTLATSLAGGIL
jgi:hypothetical protein